MNRRDMGPAEITGGYPDNCPKCGAPDWTDCICCEKCDGTGRLAIGDNMIHHETMKDCPDCGGDGINNRLKNDR